MDIDIKGISKRIKLDKNITVSVTELPSPNDVLLKISISETREYKREGIYIEPTKFCEIEIKVKEENAYENASEAINYAVKALKTLS